MIAAGLLVFAGTAIAEDMKIAVVDLDQAINATEQGKKARAAVPRSALRDWALRNVYEIYPVWRHRYAPGVTHNTEHVFGLTVPAGTPVRLNPREHLRYAWWPWREAADRCFSPSNAEAILQLPRFVVDEAS